MTNKCVTVFLVLVSLLIASRTTCAEENQTPALPVRVQQALSWLPPDSETLIVANGPFRIPPKSDEKNSHLDLVRSLSFSILTGMQDGLLQKQLEGQKVLLAVEASRRFTSPKGLGMMRYEGCQILQFDDDADEVLQAAMKTCFEKATKTRQLGTTKVAAFAEKWESDEWSLLVARPRRGILLCATNQEFLEQVLPRMDREPEDRAFPKNLPEWQHVKVDSDVWAIRHYRKDFAANDPSSPLRPKAAANVPDPKAIGLVFWFDAKPEGVAKARYLTGAKDAVKIVADGWHYPSERRTPTIKEIENGIVEISKNIIDENEDSQLFLFVLLGYLGHAVYV